MLVVNLFGGPGCGKSTTATGVFSALKLAGYNAEYVSEYAKDLTWEDRNLDNQVYILGKQYHRLFRIRNKVDIAVTDSPIILGSVYGEGMTDSFHELVFDLHHEFSNLNFLLRRVKPYMKVGRSQTEDEAKNLDGRIRWTLDHNEIDYEELDGDYRTISAIKYRVAEAIIKEGTIERRERAHEFLG